MWCGGGVSECCGGRGFEGVFVIEECGEDFGDFGGGEGGFAGVAVEA